MPGVEAVARVGGAARARVDALGWDVHRGDGDHDGGLRHLCDDHRRGHHRHGHRHDRGRRAAGRGRAGRAAREGGEDDADERQHARDRAADDAARAGRVGAVVIAGPFLAIPEFDWTPVENIDDARLRVNRPFARSPDHCAERRARLDGMPRTRRSIPLVACAVGLVLIGWGVVRTADSAHARATTAWPTVLWASVQGPAPGPVVPMASPSAPTVTPVRIELPTLGVGAPVVPVAVAGDGALGVPEDPQVVGWWAGAGDTAGARRARRHGGAGPRSAVPARRPRVGRRRHARRRRRLGAALHGHRRARLPEGALPPEVFRPRVPPGDHHLRRPLRPAHPAVRREHRRLRRAASS